MLKLCKIFCFLLLLAFFAVFLILPVFTVVEEGLRTGCIWMVCATRS